MARGSSRQSGTSPFGTSPLQRKASEASPAPQEEIAKAAYELFERRGRVSGRELEDWLEAERIVRSRHK